MYSVWVVCEGSEEEEKATALCPLSRSLFLSGTRTRDKFKIVSVALRPPWHLCVPSSPPEGHLLSPDIPYAHCDIRVYSVTSIRRRWQRALPIALRVAFLASAPRETPSVEYLEGIPCLFLGCTVVRGVGESPWPEEDVALSPEAAAGSWRACVRMSHRGRRRGDISPDAGLPGLEPTACHVVT